MNLLLKAPANRRTKTIRRSRAVSPSLRFTLSTLLCCLAASAAAQVEIDLTGYRKDSGISVRAQDANTLQVTWPTSKKTQGEMLIDLRADEPVIRSLSLKQGSKPAQILGTRLDPVTSLTIGQRDKKAFDESFRGMVFFENPRQKPYETFPVKLTRKKVRVSSEGSRTIVSVGDVSAGSFSGRLQFTFYRNSPLIRAEVVMSTTEELRAILYDTGLSSTQPEWDNLVWLDPLGTPKRMKVVTNLAARPLAVKFRAVAGENENGSIVVFPAPHQYFYPLDFANNFQFTWIGSGYSKMPAGFGFGIRQPPEGDKRWVPWFDAPPNREHHLSAFYLLSPGHGEEALAELARYTHGDRFKKCPGHRTFTSHYHIEHTVNYLDRQKDQKTDSIPRALEAPGFVTKFKDTGVEIVHLGEFHHGWTPGQKTPDRLKMQKAMHDECARLSDDEFLLLPGEEPNVHLGGHWMSFFPKPVYWVLNRSADEPFEETVEGYGKVYHVGSAEDVLNLMKKEQGLMWTAHARIKSSRKFPDGYRDQPFYQSDHFLGAAWKAMPADLSRPTLGWRVLDLLDDMNQWVAREGDGESARRGDGDATSPIRRLAGPSHSIPRGKQILGEVDVFEVHPDYELYASMNINYLRLDAIPKYADGWQPVLDALRGGEFFTTTGEVLIPRFTVARKQSGETVSLAKSGKATVEAQLEWTFPLAFAEVVSGDGQSIRRQRIELSDTESFGTRKLRVPVDLTNQKWVRFEVWDIAANGAFTQPVWVETGK
ncbi:MAG TPA: hypothetical protein VFZ59_11870 [Verrucomicrobiae bacterium]|nr:hypothetical protein [Verrucomicrobiae bacterium]